MAGGTIPTPTPETEAFWAGTQAGERLSTSADFLDFIADEMTSIARRWEEKQKILRSSR